MGVMQGRGIAELVRAAQGGDEAAFEELASRFRHGVFAWCLTQTGDAEVAEDLTQETLLRAHRELATLREPEAFWPWLRQIALNCQRMAQRRRWPENQGLLLDRSEPGDAEAFREVARRQAARELRAALAELPEKNRLAVVMFYVRGDSYREIAEFLDIPESTVAGRLWRAREQLRRSLRFRMGGDLLGDEPEE